MNLPTLDYMIGIAREKATITGQAYAVVSIDCEDERERRVVPMDYIDTVEFEAFDGRVVCVIQP